MSKKKKRVIKKALVFEVSLAAYPKNKENWILVKEDIEMDKFAVLMAKLAEHADVPAVVKEELKDFNGEISPDEVKSLLKDAGIEIPVEEKILKDEEAAKELKILKDKLSAEENKAKLLEKELRKIEKELFKKEIESKISDKDTVQMLVDMVGKVKKEEIVKLADNIASYTQIAEKVHCDSSSNADSDNTSDIIEAELKKIMKEEGIESRADALVILAERKPELIK